MGHFKKCIQASILLVICQSQYFYFICTLNVTKCKKIEDEVHKICHNKFKWIQIRNLSDKHANTIVKNQNTFSDGDNFSNISSELNKEVITKNDLIGFNREKEIIICQDILSMDMNSRYNKTKPNTSIIVIPLNITNITSLIILFSFILLGSYYLWELFTRKKCKCKLCRKEYKLINKLSEGGFGEIYRVKKDEKNYILKRCNAENITEADDILVEAKHLRDLDHKNIVKYIDDFIHIEMNKGKMDPTFYVVIIMEYCEIGDLKTQIDDKYYNNSLFSKQEILQILIQMCEGLNYLHNRNIIHRDIKSQNIFITKSNYIRIGDFGLAKKLKKGNKRNSFMTKVGTDCYMAPEVIQGDVYGKPADVWSLGCVIHELCTLNFMWMHTVSIGLSLVTQKTIDNIIDQIINQEYSFFKDLLKLIFVSNPDKRIKIDTLLKKLKKEKISINNHLKRKMNIV